MSRATIYGLVSSATIYPVSRALIKTHHLNITKRPVQLFLYVFATQKALDKVFSKASSKPSALNTHSWERNYPSNSYLITSKLELSSYKWKWNLLKKKGRQPPAMGSPPWNADLPLTFLTPWPHKKNLNSIIRQLSFFAITTLEGQETKKQETWRKDIKFNQGPTWFNQIDILNFFMTISLKR